jgi:hypothetical protein
MIRTRLITGPASEPVTLTEAKLHCRVDEAADDNVITALISAARQAVENATGRRLITQTWRASVDAWPSKSNGEWWDGVREASFSSIMHVSSEVQLPFPPLQSVTSIKTFSDADAETVYAASNYYVDISSEPGRVVLRKSASPPIPGRAANGIEIDFVCGYGATAPQALKQACLMLIGHWYENREAVGEGAMGSIPVGYEAIIAPYKVRRV